MSAVRPADELDVFNAMVLVMADFVRSHPDAFGPILTSEVTPLVHTAVGLAAKRRAFCNAAVGEATLRSLCGQDYQLFSVYRSFWRRFDCAVDDVPLRVTVNAPPEARLPWGRVIQTRFDTRFGVWQPVPDDWAMQDKVDDVTLFSDDGLDEAILARLVRLSHPGSTLTLLRPGDRCDFWFRRCGVRHDFTRLLEQLEAAGRKVEQVYASPTGAPVMLTVFGVS
jgi:hypothetical protein